MDRLRIRNVVLVSSALWLLITPYLTRTTALPMPIVAVLGPLGLAYVLRVSNHRKGSSKTENQTHENEGVQELLQEAVEEICHFADTTEGAAGRDADPCTEKRGCIRSAARIVAAVAQCVVSVVLAVPLRVATGQRS